MKVLVVLTSHSQLGNTGEKTGFWIEEFTTPYYILQDAGMELTIASPDGGQPPVDPKSETADAQTLSTKRFYGDNELIDKVANTVKLSTVKSADFDAVFYPGGHGPMWDLANDADSIALLQSFNKENKPMAFVCHAPSVLVNVKLPDGEPLVKGKDVTGFSNSEEDAVKLTSVVPFSLEDKLLALGAHYTKGENWSSYAKCDGDLITGQNPASSEAVAKLLLQALANKK